MALVELITPGPLSGAGVTLHLAVLHTVFNRINTLLFFPFVRPFAGLVSFLVKDRDAEAPGPYRLVYASGSMQDTPEFNILRARKEIQDLAGLVEAMFERFRRTLHSKKGAEMEALAPYLLLVRDFLAFVKGHVDKELTEAEAAHAKDLERHIDRFRDQLKKRARKRLESGAEVKTELLFIDLIRRVEKRGDYAYSIAEALGLAR